MLRSLTAVALALVLAAGTEAHAQRRLTGRVTAQDTGEPLAGASITVVGQAIGTVAGDAGNFSLSVPAGPLSIQVRRIGYKRRVVDVRADQTEAAVALERDVLRLEAQVVTGAATTVSRQNAANDIAVVTADQLARVPAATLENALAGKIAGAQIIANSGAPGGGNQVRLRGVTSVFGSADPLYVVDGVIVSNDVIQPGMNAISAANRGSSNASNQDNGVNRIADLNPADIESIEILKGASASAIYGSKASNGVVIIRTKAGTRGAPAMTVTQRLGTSDLARKFGARRFTLPEAIAYGAANGGFTAAQVTQNFQSCNGFCDYEEELFGEHPLSWETSLGVRGGTEGTTYFASGMDKYDGGIMKNTGYRKQSLRLNVGQLIGSKLSLQINNNFVKTVTRRGISNNDNANITPYFVLASTPSWFDMRPRDGFYPPDPFIGTNPFQNRDRIQAPEEVNRVISAIDASYQWLSTARQTVVLRVNGGIDRYNQQDNLVSPRDLYFEPNDGLPGTVTSQSGQVQNLNANFSATHTWNPTSHSYMATTSAGVQRELTARRSTNIVTRDVILGQENVNRGAATEVFADRRESRSFALFAQEEVLALQERMLVTAGVRAERSTLNGDINKYFAFPKASISYRIPSLLGRLEEFKLRAAVGQSGNQPVYLQKYSPAVAGVYDQQNGLQVGRIRGNPDIKPERQTEIEGGVDATFWHSRGSLAFTVYQKTINDVILQIATAPSLGYVLRIDNGGQFRNRGTEVALELTPVQRGPLSWISRTTFARNVGIVTSLPVPAFTLLNDVNGERVGFSAEYGLGRLEKDSSVTQIVGNDGPGRVAKRGDAAPQFTMGFSNDFNWKRVHLTTLFDWQKGGNLSNVTKNVYDAFALAPDVPDGGVARLARSGAGFAQYIEDASFVKLRELSLGYDLPASLTSRFLGAGARETRLEVSGRNLYTWTKYTGVDPEVSNFGSQQISRFTDLAPFPPSRSFFFTVSVSF